MDSVKHNYTDKRQQWLGDPTLEEIRERGLELLRKAINE